MSMIVLSVEQYMLCGEILTEIVEADRAEFGADGAEVATLYEIYLGQLRVNGVPYDETADNIYDVPAQFVSLVEEVRNVCR
jgi:hypothetical protein